VPVVSQISKCELQQAHHSTAFLSISKALEHDSAATHLKMFHRINTECRKPQMGAQCFWIGDSCGGNVPFWVGDSCGGNVPVVCHISK